MEIISYLRKTGKIFVISLTFLSFFSPLSTKKIGILDHSFQILKANDQIFKITLILSKFEQFSKTAMQTYLRTLFKHPTSASSDSVWFHVMHKFILFPSPMLDEPQVPYVGKVPRVKALVLNFVISVDPIL